MLELSTLIHFYNKWHKNRQQDFRVESNPQLIQEHYIGKLELPDLGASEYIRLVHRTSIHPSLQFIHPTRPWHIHLSLITDFSDKLSTWHIRPEYARAGEIGLGLLLPLVLYSTLPAYRKFSSGIKGPFLVLNLVLRIERPIPRKLGKWAHVSKTKTWETRVGGDQKGGRGCRPAGPDRKDGG